MNDRILVDLDGVLVDCIGPLCGLLNHPVTAKGRWPGPYRKPEQFLSYPLEDTLSRVELELLKKWMEDNTWAESRRWYGGGKAFLTHLQMQRPTTVITAGGSSSWNSHTKEFLARTIKRVTVQFTPAELKPHEPGLTLIEDRPDTATKWSEVNKGFAILIDRPWNRLSVVGPRVLRARDYAHARTLLEGLLR